MLALAPSLLWTACVTPFEVGFFSLLALDTLWYANRAVDGLLLLDVALHFLIAYPDPHTGRLVRSLPRIATRYALSWLLVDLLAALPSEPLLHLALANFEPSALLGLPSLDLPTRRVTRLAAHRAVRRYRR